MASVVLKNPPFVASASTLGTAKMYSRITNSLVLMCSSVAPLANGETVRQ